MTSLSVIVPNYNHARFLPSSLGAFLSQDRQPDEIIVIDDASTDDSVAIIQSLIAGHPHARLVRNQCNQGVIAVLNAGLAMARGDLIYFGAADDMVLPGFFSRSGTILEQFPEAAFSSARSTLIDANGGTLGLMPGAVPLGRAGYMSPALVEHLLQRDDSWIHGNTVIFRRRLLLEAGGFRPEPRSFTDGFIARALALKYGACFIPEPLAAWRRMEGGFSWNVAADLSKAEEVANNTVRLMRGEFASVFPQRYIRRWHGRYMFGARRLMLKVRLQQADITDRGRWRRAYRRAKYLGAIAYWFFSLRPLDAPAVAWRFWCSRDDYRAVPSDSKIVQ